MSRIFRKAALDRLASPEQLDALVEITTPGGWIALAGLAAMVAAAVAWAFLGSVATRVDAIGILVERGGLQEVSALAGGQVVEVAVKPGDAVAEGQILARLALPDLVADQRENEARLAALEAEQRRLAGFGSESTRLQSDAIAQGRRSAAEAIATARERVADLTARLAQQQHLVKDGLITEQVAQATRDALMTARADVERGDGALKDLAVRESDVRQRTRQENEARLERIQEAKRKIAELDEKIRHDAVVKSPSAGRVLEVRVAGGGVVKAGTPLVLLERAGAGGVEAVMYVAGTDGKKVKPGMRAEVSPSTVKREEHGALRGAVLDVAAFPATREAMLAHLGNPELVASFSRDVATPIQLRVALEKAGTPSGYAWTSKRGPDGRVEAGTLCTATITVEEKPPAALVVPLAREALGL